MAHMGYHVLQRFTKETLESLPIQSLRKVEHGTFPIPSIIRFTR